MGPMIMAAAKRKRIIMASAPAQVRCLSNGQSRGAQQGDCRDQEEELSHTPHSLINAAKVATAGWRVELQPARAFE
jgi:ATP-dependent protease ClpP protease subunit